jgi:hypothetical protein
MGGSLNTVLAHDSLHPIERTARPERPGRLTHCLASARALDLVRDRLVRRRHSERDVPHACFGGWSNGPRERRMGGDFDLVSSKR